MRYDARQIGSNSLLLVEEVSISQPYFLCVFTNPWDESTFTAIVEGYGSELNWTLPFVGIAQAYQDLLSGSIYFKDLGTYDVDIYAQASSTNTDTDNATFILSIKLQVT